MRKGGAWLFLRLLLLLTVMAIAGCGGAAGTGSPPPPREVVSGFLDSSELPHGISLLPPPPAVGSAAYKADEEVYLATLKFRGTPRWDLARADADLDSPGGPAAFSCAVGTPVSPEMTPRVIRLMETVKADAGRTNSYTKKHYLRTRPFVVFGESTCMKDAEPFLKSNGSYPSAHATIGWTWALILAEMVPARAERILERGLSYGESRVICGVHWQSDIDAGRLLGSAVTARLHGDPLFRAELQAAGEELRAAREKGHTPLQDCRAEDAILKTGRR